MDMRRFSLAKHDPQLMQLMNLADHHALAQWAIECLQRVLDVFEERYPADRTPQKAVAILEEWMQGRISMWEARKFCWTVLKLAREIEPEDKVCCQILRAANHCLAVCHVPSHAEGTAMYVVSAIQHLNQGKDNVIELMERERQWQVQRLEELADLFTGSGTIR